MTKTFKMLAFTAAAVVCGALPAAAQTVTETTVVTQKKIPDTNTVNFSDFDANKDGVLSMREVGERIFYSFDTDANMILDNNEWDKKSLITIVPVKEETLTTVDWNNDGKVDDAKYSYGEFAAMSKLALFDTNKDGLSPEEFIGHKINVVDMDKSGTVDVEEWKKVYLEELQKPLHNEPTSYQD